jgi:hypothetical protein
MSGVSFVFATPRIERCEDLARGLRVLLLDPVELADPRLGGARSSLTRARRRTQPRPASASPVRARATKPATTSSQ